MISLNCLSKFSRKQSQNPREIVSFVFPRVLMFPKLRDLTLSVFFVFLDFQLHFNNNKRITAANQNSRLSTYNNTTLILKTTKWMIYRVLSLYYLHLFPSLAAVSLWDDFKNRCFLAWGFMFVLFCSFTRKKTGSVFLAFCHATFHKLCFDHRLQQWWKSWHFLAIHYAMSFIILRNLEIFASSL